MVETMTRQARQKRRRRDQLLSIFSSPCVVKRSDGMYWMGPDYRHGITFTNFVPWIFIFDNKRSAISAIRTSGIEKWLQADKDHSLSIHDGTLKITKAPKASAIGKDPDPCPQ